MDLKGSLLIEAVVDQKGPAGSTEELCAELKTTIERIARDEVQRGQFQQEGALIVGSKDVDAHYPNIDVEVAAEEMKLEIEHSNLDVEVNTVEVALYLASTMSPEEIEKEELSDCVHKRPEYFSTTLLLETWQL